MKTENEINESENIEQREIEDEANIEEPKDEGVRVSSKSKGKKKKKSKPSAETPKAVKYRMTFLVSRPFQGGMYKKGDVILVDEHIKKSYEHRENEFKFDAE